VILEKRKYHWQRMVSYTVSTRTSPMAKQAVCSAVSTVWAWLFGILVFAGLPEASVVAEEDGSSVVAGDAPDTVSDLAVLFDENVIVEGKVALARSFRKRLTKPS